MIQTVYLVLRWNFFFSTRKQKKTQSRISKSFWLKNSIRIKGYFLFISQLNITQFFSFFFFFDTRSLKLYNSPLFWVSYYGRSLYLLDFKRFFFFFLAIIPIHTVSSLPHTISLKFKEWYRFTPRQFYIMCDASTTKVFESKWLYLPFFSFITDCWIKKRSFFSSWYTRQWPVLPVEIITISEDR